MLKRLLLAAAFLLCASPAWAACGGSDPNWTAATWADVQDCIDNQASNGDTITITADITATTTLTVDVAVTLKGADCTLGTVGGEDDIPTSCAIQITDDTADGTKLIDVILVENQNTRLAHLEFIGDATTNFADAIVVTGCMGDSRSFRADHLIFNGMRRGAFQPNSVRGVVDHVEFRVTDVGGGAASWGVVFGHIYGFIHTNCGVNNYGDLSVAATPGFGSADTLFIEDVTMTNESTTRVAFTDCEYGARYVIRFSHTDDGSLECHGNEAERYRGIRAVEAYENDLTGQDQVSTPMYWRGGTVLNFSNRLLGWTGASANLGLVVNLLFQHGNFPFGGANGRNPWDENDGGNPYNPNDAACTSTDCTATSAGTLTVTVSGANWTTNEWTNYTINKTTGIAVTSMSRTGSTVTVDTSAAHGLEGGFAAVTYNLSGGTGYSNDTGVATTGGSGSGLTVDTTTSGGVITSIAINAPGTNYLAADTITITGGGGNATFQVLPTGDLVSCWGASDYGYNQMHTVLQATDTDTFTFSDRGYGFAASPTGTIYCTPGNNFSVIDSNTADTITFSDALNGAAYRLIFAANEKFEFNKVTFVKDQVGVGRGTSLAGTLYPSLPGGWNDQVLEPMYEWLNTREAGALVHFANTRAGSCGGTCTVPTLTENTHYYNYTASFDGTAGVGSGTRAMDRPATCTTGVAFWSTDQGGDWNTTGGDANDGALDMCTATDTWTNDWYIPYDYPHALTTGGDIVDPTAGGGGTLTASAVTSSGFTVSWTKGSDDVSAEAALQYNLCYSTSNNVDTAANALANGTCNGYETDIATDDFTGLAASTTYYFNVVIKDEAGNTAAYTMNSQATSAAAAAGGGARLRLRVR